MPPSDRFDHFVPLLAYSTGLLAGQFLVDIVAHLIGVHPREGNRMSTVEDDLRQALQEITEPTAKAEVRRVLDALPEEFALGDIIEELDEREHLRAGLWSALKEPLVDQEEGEAGVESGARGEPARTNANAAEWTALEDAPDLDAELSITRGDVLEVLGDLPDNCTVDDILHTLYVRSELKQAIWSLENEPTYTQEEVEQSLSRWLTD